MDALSGRTFPVLDPRSGEEVFRVAGECGRRGWASKPRHTLLGATPQLTCCYSTLQAHPTHPTSPPAEADKEDVELAVAAARKAFDEGEWPRMSGKQRGKVRRVVELRVTCLACLAYLRRPPCVPAPTCNSPSHPLTLAVSSQTICFRC